MKTQPKITPTDLRRMAEAMVTAGKMPSLETVLEAVAVSRLKYRDKLLQARREHEARQKP
jgi:hypothetical protein